MKTKILLRIIPLLTAALLTAGCAQSEKSDGQTDISSAEESIAEFEPVPIPEGGWTYEEVAKTVYINGRQISYPFTVESLGEGYSIKKKTTMVEDNGDVWTTLYYDNTPVCTLRYEKLGSSRDLEGAFATGLSVSDLDYWNNECAYGMVKVNGIGLFDDLSAVEELFGEPDGKSGTGWMWAYYNAGTKDSCIGFTQEEEKITFIGVYFDKIER